MSNHEDTKTAKAVTGKPNAFHEEDVVEGVDYQMSPWQCLVQNPKIVAWSLFANSEFSISTSRDPNPHD